MAMMMPIRVSFIVCMVNVLSRKRRRTCSANPQFGGKCGWSSARIIGLGECPVKAGFHGPIHGGVGILPASIAIPVNETQGYLHDVEKVSHLITFWLTPLETQSQIARILAVVWRLRGAKKQRTLARTPGSVNNLITAGDEARLFLAIAASHTPLWLASGWGCRGRRLPRVCR